MGSGRALMWARSLRKEDKTHVRRRGQVAAEAEGGGTGPQATGRQEAPEGGRGRKDPSPCCLQREHGPAHTTTSGSRLQD